MTTRWWKAQKDALGDAGGAAVGLVPHVMHVAGLRGLPAPREPAVLIPQDHRVADPGGHVIAET